MFPISPLFFEAMVFSLPLLASVLIALRLSRSIWLQMTSLIPLLFSAVFVSFYDQHGFGIFFALSYLVVTVPALIALIIYSVLLRRYAPSLAKPLGGSVAFLAISATLVFTAYSFVGQWVPDTPCTQDRLSLAIGTTEVVVHPEMQPIIYSDQVPGSARLSGEWSGTSYGPEPRQKYGVRALCRAAARGNGAVPDVSEFQISPARILASLRSACESSDLGDRPYCLTGSLDVLDGISNVRVQDARGRYRDSEALSVYCHPEHDDAPVNCVAYFTVSGDVRIEVTAQRGTAQNEGIDLGAQVGMAALWLAEIWSLDALSPADSKS